MGFYKILILEDHLGAVRALVEKLYALDREFIASGSRVLVSIFSTEREVEEYLNNLEKIEYDVILLDREAGDGGTFHILDFTKVDTSKIIGISSLPRYNEELRRYGVSRMITKDYDKLEKFADEVVREIRSILNLSG